MRFHICSEDGRVIAANDLVDEFAAQNWAMDWVRKQAERDTYLLESEGGGFAMTLFKTKAGQWYRMPKLAPA